MKKYLLLIVMAISSSGMMAQFVNPQVVAASGSDYQAANFYNNFTVGEPIVDLVSSGGLNVSQGFQQSNATCFALNGGIATTTGIAIPNVIVGLNGYCDSVQTIQNSYSFTLLGGKYTIRPNKNNDKTIANGVNGTDISLIQSHILKKVILNSPYKLIAADVNSDGAVNGTDIALIKSLILKHISTFFGNKLWAFVDSNYVFANPTKPFPFKDSISFDYMNANQPNQSFIGIKLGDVNSDWNAAGLGINNRTTSIELFNDNISLNNVTTEVRVPIKVKNFKNIMGMQYTLNFNSDVLELKSVENNKLGADYNTDYAAVGKIPFLYVNPASEATTLSDSTILFELVFTKKGNLNNETIGLTSDITSISAFDGNYATVGIIKTGGSITDNVIIADNLLVYPNPANDYITIKGAHINGVQVIDNLGKVVKSVSLKDANNPKLTLGSMAKGVYHLRIQTTDGKVNSVGFIKE